MFRPVSPENTLYPVSATAPMVLGSDTEDEEPLSKKTEKVFRNRIIMEEDYVSPTEVATDEDHHHFHLPISASALVEGSDPATEFEEFFLRSLTAPPWKEGRIPDPIFTKNSAFQIANRKRALEDHQITEGDLPIDDTERFLERFHFNTTCSSNKGPRPSNEDCHLIVEPPELFLFGVFDGHGIYKKYKRPEHQDGYRAAKIAAKSAEDDLISLFNQWNFLTIPAFEAWAEKVHQKIPKDLPGGTTAAIALVEKVNGILHVLNIGDSKVVVFRKHNGKIYPIPMSPIRDWNTPECVQRVKEILSPEEFAIWCTYQGKHRRFPPRHGVNGSNFLGDHQQTYNGKSAITHDPICSQFQLKPGDVLINGCDGLWDYSSCEKLAALFAPQWDNPDADFADLAAQYALDVGESKDNVTVIAAKMELGKAPEDLKRAKTVPIEIIDLT